MSMHVGSFQAMKQLNKSTILHLIRTEGLVSRADIAKKTSLTPATVTNLVAECMEADLVIESAFGESSGGRKPILLKINSDAFYGIGVYASAKKIKVLLADLSGQILQTQSYLVPESPTEQIYLEAVAEAIDAMYQVARSSVHSLLGIGIGMHGVVDTKRGISIFAPHIHMRNLPIRDFMEKRFGVPVEVDNDVRALALAESWFGQGQGVQNFVCIHAGSGVGAGLIVDGQLYSGTSFAAGEIGHTTLEPEGPLCSCGNSGCLEALASGEALARRAHEALAAGVPSLLQQKLTEESYKITGASLYEAAIDGDLLSIQLLNEAGKYLGIGVANLINLLNPSSIILTGGVVRAGKFVLEPLFEAVKKRALHAAAKEVTIVSSELGDYGSALGAFTLMLKKMFDTGFDGPFETGAGKSHTSI